MKLQIFHVSNFPKIDVLGGRFLGSKFLDSKYPFLAKPKMGHPAFVACSPDNNVAVINLATLEVVGRIDAGGNPDGVAWATRH
jgi:YVTN family beta-propeller protein